jgi:hypothetical protein
MNAKLVIPAILGVTVLIAGMFAFMPVEKASTVHTFLSQQGAVKGTQYIWEVNGGDAAASNGTLLANFASSGVTKVTGTMVVNQNSTQQAFNHRAQAAGTMDVYSGNGTQVASASTLDTQRSFTFTLGGNGLDLRANVSATNVGKIIFTVVDTD